MSKAKHTPGPWTVREVEWNGSNRIRAILTEAGDFIAEAHEDEASFIAAAPDMYDVLELIADGGPNFYDTATCSNMVNHALAKARGGSDPVPCD